VIVNRLIYKSTQKRQRKRERRHARCTLHRAMVVRLDLISTSEKSRSLLARSRSKKKKKKKKRPRRRYERRDALPDSGQWKALLPAPLPPPPPSAARTPFSLARSRLSPSFCYESAASGARRCDNKAILLFITGRLTSRAHARARARIGASRHADRRGQRGRMT